MRIDGPPLRWRNINVIPMIHGRLPFALAVRECMLRERHAAIAVELPPSLKERTLEGIDDLPRVQVVLYREAPEFLQGGSEWDEPSTSLQPHAWYLPIDPCDGIIEALRIARGERLEINFVDAEIEQFVGRNWQLPDSYAALKLGIDKYYQAVLPQVRALHPQTHEDAIREAHMAARLREISTKLGEGRSLLFLCGLVHWQRILRHLERGTEQLHESEGPSPELVELVTVHEASLFHILGETSFATYCYEQHRSSWELSQHDQILGVKELLLAARSHYERQYGDSLERPTPTALRTILDYVRKLTLASGRLSPDLYSLVVAAKGIVGNDFALAVLDMARSYPPNAEGEVAGGAGGDHWSPREQASPEPEEDPGPAPEGEEDPTLAEGEPVFFEMTSEKGRLQGGVAQLISRTPGEMRELKRLRLEAPPPPQDQRKWRSIWNPYSSCSWPPEDIVIENLRSYISQRTLSLAGLDLVRTEEFTSSLKDGLALRETLRDLPRRKLHVKVEPRVPGKVGAVVLIFEEDDDGSRYPWRSTWMAEHEEESTLAFYATNYMEDLVGPGIGRARYGGCMLIFPPLWIPDVWDDLRFERARRPSERLLLAAIYHGRDRYVAHVSDRPPAREVQLTAERYHKHIIHLPLSTFSSHMLERIRRVHVLNDKYVRSWAARYIR